MSFSQFLLILRARWLVVALTIAVFSGAALVLNKVLPRKYSATATIVVDAKTPDLITGALLPILPGYLGTQVEIIKSRRVAVEVVRKLKLAEIPSLRAQFTEATGGRGSVEDYVADLVLKGVDVDIVRESNLINITYEGQDARFAKALADAFAEAYIETSLALRVEPARQSAIWFDEQISGLKRSLEAAQSKLAKYQQDKGIVATDERLDVENSRLSELSAQLTVAQSSGYDTLSRLNQLRDFTSRGADPLTLPEVLANPLIQTLKNQLAQSESRLGQVSSQFGRNHPEVERLRADIDTQRAKFTEEIQNVASSMANASKISQRRESELRAAVSEQKAKVLRLIQNRDELSVLMRDVESAQRALEAASSRFTQTNLESQATQTNAVLLTSAIEPLGPSFPRKKLNLLIAVIAGFALGVGLAFLWEAFDARVRSRDDVVEILEMPLIGELGGRRPLWARARRVKAPSRPRLPFGGKTASS